MRAFLILLVIVAAIGGAYWFFVRAPMGAPPPATEITDPAPPVDTVPTVTPVIVDIDRSKPRAAANGGSAVVLLTDNAAAADRNTVTCLNVWDVMDAATTGEIQVGLRKAEDGTVEALRPLYWLTVAPLAAGEHTCAERLAAYDFARAATIRAKYGLNDVGPYILVARADEQAAAVINLTGKTDREIADLVRYFRDGFAYQKDIWDPARLEPERVNAQLSSFFGARFRDSLVQALAFISTPAARAGCKLGDLADTACAT